MSCLSQRGSEVKVEWQSDHGMILQIDADAEWSRNPPNPMHQRLILERHWETSGVFGWRRPDMLVRDTCELFTIHQVLRLRTIWRKPSSKHLKIQMLMPVPDAIG